MSPSKIYIVTSGDYSDYGINAVFLDEDNANEYAKKTKTNPWIGEPSVEVYFDGGAPKEWKETFLRMDKAGNVSDIEVDTCSPISYTDKQFNGFESSKETFSCRLRTDDVEAAIKTMNDIRIQLLAQNRWGDDSFFDSV